MTSTSPRSSPAIPDPLDWPRLRTAIERARGRRLLLAAVEMSSERPSLWVATDDIDLIVYSREAERDEQLRAIAHQAAHIFLGHQAFASDGGVNPLPHLALEFVAATIVICGFSEADEVAADSLAARIVTGTSLPEITARSGLAQDRTLGDLALEPVDR